LTALGGADDGKRLQKIARTARASDRSYVPSPSSDTNITFGLSPNSINEIAKYNDVISLLKMGRDDFISQNEYDAVSDDEEDDIENDFSRGSLNASHIFRILLEKGIQK
jgi:hypothetical protein